MKELQTNRFYDFGAFRLDAKKRRLLCGEEIISLTPKEFELLFLLVKNAGKVVEKDDLLDEIWKDTFVEEGTLTRNISWLRKKLAGVGEQNVPFIETVPKRGYRFLPEVTSEAEKALVIEEQTLTRIRIEEKITIPEKREIIIPPILPSNNLAVKKDSPNTEKQRKKINLFVPILGIPAIVLIAFLAYQFIFRSPNAKTILVSKVAPFSGLAGREDTPSFSPDGKQVAFAWNGGEAENLNIYVKFVGSGDPLRLTTSAQNDFFPIFSPDASQIAFVRTFSNHSEVIIVPALGGAERKICELKFFASVSFSPDGQTLAVADIDEISKQYGIYLVNLKTDEKRKLTEPILPAYDNAPRFSPDGKNITFVRSFGDFIQELMIIPVSGGEARQLTFDKSKIRSVAWSADSKQLFFISYRSNNQTNLWQIPAGGGEPQLISTGGKNMRNIAVSPDKKNIAFVEETEDTNIRKIFDDSRAEKFIASARSEHSQQISPDGTRIVFVSDRSGRGEIWISDTDGKNQRQLTKSENAAGSPRISPDGKSVVFDKQFGESSNVFAVSIEGGEPRRLTDNKLRDVLPAWSADGKSVYFSSNRGGNYQIWKVSASGGEAVQLTKQGGFESFAAPDGKTVYYSKNRGVAGLWQISTDGENEIAAAALAEAGFWRSWTVTNSGVFFAAYSPNPPYQIKLYDFSNGQTKVVRTVEKAPLWNYSGLAASDDGKLILYAQSDQNTSSIMLAELGD